MAREICHKCDTLSGYWGGGGLFSVAVDWWRASRHWSRASRLNTSSSEGSWLEEGSVSEEGCTGASRSSPGGHRTCHLARERRKAFEPPDPFGQHPRSQTSSMANSSFLSSLFCILCVMTRCLKQIYIFRQSRHVSMGIFHRLFSGKGEPK